MTWVVRNHSALPFAALEGVVIEWSLRYMDFPKVVLACNDYRTDVEFVNLVRAYKPDWGKHKLKRRVQLLPNYYPSILHHRPPQTSNVLDVSCFGAIRPPKESFTAGRSGLRFR